MIVLIPIALLLFIVLVKVIADWREYQSTLFEFLIVGGVFTVWLLLYLSPPEQPLRVALLPWGADVLFPTYPTLLIDEYAWIYVAALAGLAVSVVMMRQKGPSTTWALGLISVGMVGVLSENSLTLLFIWTLLDFLWIALLLRHRDPELSHGRFVLFFLYRMLGPVCLIYVSFLSFLEQGSFSFQEMQPEIGIYLLGAAIFRLDYWFPSAITGEKWEEKGGLFAVNHAAPMAISLMLVTRVAEMGGGEISSGPLLILPLLFLVFGGSFWWLATHPSHGRGGWTVGLFGLSLSAAIFGLPQASIAWGLPLILSGNVLFLSRIQGQFRIILSVLLFLGLCGLPFTPLWEGRVLFSRGVRGLLLGLGYGVLFLGALRFMYSNPREREPFGGAGSILALVGLLFLPLTQFLLGMSLDLFQDSMSFWKGGWWFLIPYAVFLPFPLLRWLKITIPDWVRNLRTSWARESERMTSVIFPASRAVSGLVMGIFKLLEGRGGVIWALLGVFLLLSLLALGGGG